VPTVPAGDKTDGVQSALVEAPPPESLTSTARRLVELADGGDVLLHGSGRAGLTTLAPVQNDDFLGRSLRAVFAASDGCWPVYFAIVNRRAPGLKVLRNLCFVRPGKPTLYHFGISRPALESGQAYTPGWVYVVPRSRFQQGVDEGGAPSQEWWSPEPVDVIDAIRVEPEDFPHLDAVVAIDDDEILDHADRVRMDELLAAVVAELVGLDEVPDGVEMRFGASCGPQLEELVALVARDSIFLRPVVRMEGDVAVVTITGPPGTADLVAREINRFV
jgi:hypothetical protein